MLSEFGEIWRKLNTSHSFFLKLYLKLLSTAIMFTKLSAEIFIDNHKHAEAHFPVKLS